MFGCVKRVGAASGRCHLEVTPGSFDQVGRCNQRIGYLSFWYDVVCVCVLVNISLFFLIQ